MHISEGVLSVPVLASGGALALAGVAAGIRHLGGERMITVSVLSAAFFVASLIHVPAGVSSVHLILNGLVGMILGWAAFPAIFTGLLLQAVFFQFGGLAVLGVNTLNMALPAVLCGLLFRPFLFRGRRACAAASFACGILAVAGAAFMTALSLFFTSEGFLLSARLLFIANLPVMAAEGLVTMLTAGFLVRACPEIFSFRDEPEASACEPSAE